MTLALCAAWRWPRLHIGETHTSKSEERKDTAHRSAAAPGAAIVSFKLMKSGHRSRRFYYPLFYRSGRDARETRDTRDTHTLTS